MNDIPLLQLWSHARRRGKSSFHNFPRGEDTMTDSRTHEILQDALKIASGQKSTNTEDTARIRAIGRYSADLLNALVWLEDAASTYPSPFVGDDRQLKGALDFCRKVIHAAGGLTVAEETQANLVKDLRTPDPVEERLDKEEGHA